MIAWLGHCVRQLRSKGWPNFPSEQLPTQLRVELSPKVMLGVVGQFMAVTQRMLKFYEYVGMGRAEQVL